MSSMMESSHGMVGGMGLEKDSTFMAEVKLVNGRERGGVQQGRGV